MGIVKSTFKFLWYGSIGASAFYLRRSKFPQILSNSLVKLGPVYVKMGQVISTRRDVIPEEYTEKLATLCDDVPPEKEKIMRKILRENLPEELEDIFCEFSEEPIAAGSVAQVYKAKLHSGEVVAVKVLRPNILKQVQENFKFLSMAVNICEFLVKKIRMVNLPGIVNELEDLLITQTDLTHETDNFLRFKELFADEPNLTVPKVFPEYSSCQVMVTEFVDAIQPYEYEKLNIPGEELASRVDNLMDSMIFLQGLCHADLHPGNFFWNAKGELVLIDFGLVHEFPVIDRNHLTTYYFSLVEGFYHFATEYFIDHFIIPHPKRRKKDFNKDQLLEELYKIVKALSHSQEGFSVVFYELVQVLSRYQLQLKPNTSKMFLTLITVEGYILHLNPNFDMIENTRKKKMDMAEYTSLPEEVEKILMQDFGSYSTALFKDNCSIQQAYKNRNEFTMKQIGLEKGHFVIDVGCGRGQMLGEMKNRGAEVLGITISKTEQRICAEQNLDCVWSSWEDFDNVVKTPYPLADAIIIIEILVHMATLFESRAGLMDLRLQKLFAWCSSKLKDQGKLYIQVLNADSRFIEGTKYKDTSNDILKKAPILGFASVKQLVTNSDPYFEVVEINNHSEDLLKTYYFFQSQFDKNEKKLAELLDPRFHKLMRMELNILTELAEKKIMKLHRLLLQKKA
ncbi:AarF/UbiB family protein [Candidatus Uabimicrobium sp. HlEnr_7]|uniref:AarF/UbiB family protein n=1 Tax=Candidatus Uabimicrobium helgolandensis TaxID=3095367 RepID=UPI003557030D